MSVEKTQAEMKKQGARKKGAIAGAECTVEPSTQVSNGKEGIYLTARWGGNIGFMEVCWLCLLSLCHIR